MPGAHDLFSPSVPSNSSSSLNNNSPNDLISPSTRRHVTIASAAATPSVVLTPSTTVNDDEREKRDRRRSKVLELQRRHVSSPATTPADRRRSMPGNGLSNQQLADHYANCIKLSAENKINAKNAFGLHLIDYMSELLRKKDMNNFQVASSTLDASAKIYAGRVDAIHTETYKVLTGLGRTDHKAERGQGDGDHASDEDGNAQAENDGPTKRKRARRSHTIETNLKNLNVNKFDLEFEVDPLFNKTSAAFDEGGTGGLLMNHLCVLDDTSELVLDSNTIVTSTESRLSESQHCISSIAVDLSDLRTTYSCLNLDNLQVCPPFADFEFTKWDQKDEEDLCTPLAPSNAKNEHAFDLEAEAEPFPSDTVNTSGTTGGTDEGFMDDFAAVAEDEQEENEGPPGGLDLSDVVFRDGKEAQLVENALQNMKHGTIGTLMQILAAEPSDYSYFNSKLLRTWAGPSHWKLKSKSKSKEVFAGHLGGERGKRKEKKEAFVIDYDEKIDFDNFFKEKRTATMLTKATLDKYSKSQTTLPEDLHYDVDKLFRLFVKAKLMIKRQQEKEGNPCTDVDEVVENYDYDNANDRDNFCPAQEDDDDDDVEGGMEFDLTSDNNDLSAQGSFLGDTMLGDKLVDQPHKVAKLDIGYAKAAKKMDVKKLKNSIWKILVAPENDKENDETESVSPPPEAEVAGPHSFQKMVENLPHKVSRNMAKNLSVPIAFVCLLHLANEKSLEIKTGEDMSDLTILQG